jgi:hypothetical protein
MAITAIKAISLKIVPEHWEAIKVLANERGISRAAFLRTLMYNTLKGAGLQPTYVKQPVPGRHAKQAQ